MLYSENCTQTAPNTKQHEEEQGSFIPLYVFMIDTMKTDGLSENAFMTEWLKPLPPDE
jgi:hypothetical protein